MKDEAYIIVRGKELAPNDVIIHIGERFVINSMGFGRGAGSFDFGEYIWVEGKWANSTSSRKEEFWLLRESPIVKAVYDSSRLVPHNVI